MKNIIKFFGILLLLILLQATLRAQEAYYIKSAIGGKYLDITAANKNAGALLQLWDFVGGDNQIWILTTTGKNHFIKSKFGRYMDVQWGNANAEALVHIWDFNGGDAQKWRLIPTKDGYYYIQSKLGTYLDVKWGNSASGTPVWMWAFNGGNAQKWKLEPVPNYRPNGIGVVSSGLSIVANSKWAESTICVCWENPSADNASQRDLVRQAVLDSWESVSTIRFYGWRQCTGYESGIRIKIADENPRVKAIGNRLNGMMDGMVLNFTFSAWCPQCRSDYNNSVRSIAIHEFGHALGFTHEHNRKDCGFACNDAPQGTNGDWNITDCDAQSIMNYCFNSGYRGNLSNLDIQGIRGVYGSSIRGRRETRAFRPQSIGSFCPTVVIQGDREFGGNGPRMHSSISLQISPDGQHLEAVVDLHAFETGGDNSTTVGRWIKRVWSVEPGKRIVSIDSDTYSEVNFTSEAAGAEFAGCNDGKVYTPPIDGGRLARVYQIIGDTGGGDISDDNNCSCDTQIRSIEFNEVRLTIESR